MDNSRKRVSSSSSSNTPSHKGDVSGSSSSSVAKRRSPAHPDVLAFGFNSAANTESVTPSHVVPPASKVTMESGKDNDSDDADDFVHDKNWHQRSVAVQQGKKTQPFSQPSSRDQSASSVVTTKKSQPTAASKAKVGGGQSLVVGNRRAPRPPDQSAPAFDLKSIASGKHPHLQPLDLHDSDAGQSSQQQPIKEKAKKSRTELGLNVSAQIASRPPATEIPAKGSSNGNSSSKNASVAVGTKSTPPIHTAGESVQASKLSGSSRESTFNSGGGGHGKRKGPTPTLTITYVQINSSATDDSSRRRDSSSPVVVVAEEPAKKKARLSSSGESVHSLDKHLAAPTPVQKPVGVISANRRLSTSTAPVSPQQPQQQNMSETKSSRTHTGQSAAATGVSADPHLWRPGDLVWAKMNGFPYWPGKIVPESEMPQSTKKKQPSSFRPVFFFGSHNYAYVNTKLVKDSLSFHEEVPVKQQTREWKSAVDEMKKVAGRVNETDKSTKRKGPDIEEECLPTALHSPVTPDNGSIKTPISAQMPTSKTATHYQLKRKRLEAEQGKMNKDIQLPKANGPHLHHDTQLPLSIGTGRGKESGDETLLSSQTTEADDTDKDQDYLPQKKKKRKVTESGDRSDCAKFVQHTDYPQSRKLELASIVDKRQQTQPPTKLFRDGQSTPSTKTSRKTQPPVTPSSSSLTTTTGGHKRHRESTTRDSESDGFIHDDNWKKRRGLSTDLSTGVDKRQTTPPTLVVPSINDQPTTTTKSPQSSAAQPGPSSVAGKKKRKHKKKRHPSTAESVQPGDGDGGGSQPLSLVSSKSSQASTKSQVEKTRRLDQLLEKYNNVVQAVDKDENSHIPNDQLIQDRLISYFAKELAEVEDPEGDEAIDQGDAVTRAAVQDIVDRMSQESLKRDPGRLVLLNSLSNATVSRKMFGGFRKWLKYCRETDRDYREFDKDSASAFLLWLKAQTFKRRGAKTRHYYCGSVEGYMVSAYTMLRVGGYYKADQRLKDILGSMSFVAARYCRRNIGTDKQNRAQITLVPDETDLLSLQMPFDTPSAVQNLLYIHMVANLGLRPSSLLRGRPSENRNQNGLLVKDISFKRDSDLRLRMKLRIHFFKDVVDRGHFKDPVVRERDNPFCLVRLTLLQLMLMGCVEFTSPNFMRQGEIKVRPPRDDINLFCATDLNNCLLVGMPIYDYRDAWNGLARTVGLPEHGLSARSCRRGFVTATALSLLSDDVDSTVGKLLDLLRSLNMWRGNAALSYIEQDLYWLANVAEKLHPNQPVSFKALPAKLVWQYAYHRCIDKDEYEDPTDPEMRERVKASKYFESTLQETIDEKTTNKEPIDMVKITSSVLTSLCTRMANESNRKGYDDKAAEITVKPLPEMPLEVLDVELIAQKLKGTHVENLSFIFRAGLARDSEKCPADVVCEAIGCNKRFRITGDYEKHRVAHVAAKHKFTCKLAQCPKKDEVSADKLMTHAHRKHYLNRTCDLCGNRCSTREACYRHRTTSVGSSANTMSTVPFFIAQFLGMRKAVVDEGHIRYALEAVERVKICDEVAGSDIQSYPLLPMVARRRQLDEPEGSFKGDKYNIYKNSVKEFNQALKILELRRKGVEESQKLMDDNECDSD